MVFREGHLVNVTAGLDKGAEGIVTEVDDDVIYITKTEGNFKEMYDTHNNFGFFKDRVEITIPKLFVKDKIRVKEKAYDKTKLDKYSDNFSIDKVGVILKLLADGSVLTNLREEAIPPKYIIVHEVKKSAVRKTISVKAGDIVYYKNGTGIDAAKVRGQYGTAIEIEDIHYDTYEIKRKDLCKKVSVSEMLSLVTVKKAWTDLEKAKTIIKDMEIIKKLLKSDSIKRVKPKPSLEDPTLTDHVPYDPTMGRRARHYNEMELGETKQIDNPLDQVLRKLRYELKLCTKPSIRTMKLKDESHQLGGTTLSDIKQAYWEVVRKVRCSAKVPVKYTTVLGQKVYKKSGVYTKAGTIAKIAKQLKSSSLVLQEKVPYTKAKYVGIELELYSRKSRDDLNDMFTAAGLGKNINLVNDLSIKRFPEGFSSIEVRMLATESTVHSVIERTAEILKVAEAGVNETCGLHVHLDMRNRDVKKAFKNLYNSQDVLFKAVPKERHTNPYCKKIPDGNFLTAYKRSAHYDAISASAYRKLRTLEVRMHEGSVDAKVISNWVNLLISIVETKKVKKFKVVKDFVGQLPTLSQDDKDFFQSRLVA
tara:strand:+ start:899 stop:2668 length:1770 start_codon:yes stop_codon:yes gene_type:complete